MPTLEACQEHSDRGIRLGGRNLAASQDTQTRSNRPRGQVRRSRVVRILPTRMNRASLHRWALWLVPLLLARAFVPLGFMLSADASGLSLVFCTMTAGATKPQSQADHHDHSAHQDRASEPQADGLSLCPYALACASLGHDIQVTTLSQSPASYDLTPDFGQPLGPKSLKSHLIRGPPSRA